MNTDLQVAKDNLIQAQAQQAKYANEGRREEEFQEGEKVMLSTTNFTLGVQKSRPSRKLQHKFTGPFKIVKKISPVAYQLDLPSDTKLHPVFHVSLLKKFREDPFHRRTEAPPPIQTDTGEEFEVEKILDKKTKWRKTYYLVKWAGYPDHEATWKKLRTVKTLLI